MIDKKILVTGGSGMLAYAFRHICSDFDVVFLDRDECDIADPASIEACFKAYAPEIVINCAAYTAVDNAEEDFEAAKLINAEGVKHLAKACKVHGALLVHYSTDYVFDGGKESYDEDDIRDPLNKYGESKAIGEKHLEEINPSYYLIRTAWLYGPNGKNFPETMIALSEKYPELTVVNDQIGSPTFTMDLAQVTLELIEGSYQNGNYHLTNSGSCSWFEFCREIFTIMQIETPLKPVGSSVFPRPAKRPAFSVLNNNVGPKVRPWQDALKDYLDNYR